MTEQEWLSCTNPRRMIASLRGVADRKFFLLAAACCRRLWGLFPHPALHNVSVTIEQFADSRCTWGDVLATRGAAHEAAKAERRESKLNPAKAWSAASVKTYHATLALLKGTPRDAARTALGELAYAAYFVARDADEDTTAAYKAERQAQCGLLRDLFAFPRRRVSLVPGWLTPTVQTVAQAAYDERLLPSGELELARLAILADALEDAGCSEASILTHLRGPGPHVRGCWVLDLLRGQ
jgi:hypothetical protein